MIFNTTCTPAQVLSGEFVFRFYCGYLYMVTFPALYNCLCSAWKPGLKESWCIVPRNESVCKFDNGWGSEPFCLHCFVSKVVLENLERMFLWLWNVLPSTGFSLQLWHVAISSAAHVVTLLLAVGSDTPVLLEEQFEVHGAAPWCIQQEQKQNCKAVTTGY